LGRVGKLPVHNLRQVIGDIAVLICQNMMKRHFICVVVLFGYCGSWKIINGSSGVYELYFRTLTGHFE